ncbi:MAG: zinc metallopeptidase [Anaerolineae bacterium]|nr:zinc metallopeptidase [Anaerolineae bacterium]
MSYYIFMLPAILIMMATQSYVKSAYRKWSQVPNQRNMTGAEAAQRLIRAAGIGRLDSGEGTGGGLRIEQIGGSLTDHYDPRAKVLRLSPGVAQGKSVASLAIAAHELGHAQQDAEEYFPLRLRGALVPAVNIGSSLGWILILAGLFLQITNLSYLGLVIFSLGAVFALATLPVEFDASARAKRMLADTGIITSEQERRGVNNVLNAAALTYVAALVTAVMQVLYYSSLVRGRRR